ncbi:MAG: sigma-70 family RNA polymerase sigma factor [Polyangiaceae bacterium]|nr:sigma-70 family RNA polymerase sigma factor [Polyangiaceae bacterium]
MSAGEGGPRPPLTPEQRALIEGAMPMILRMVAAMLIKRPDADQARLLSAATEGLIRAAVTYDPARCDRFEPYAWELAFLSMASALSPERSSASSALEALRRAGIATAAMQRDETRPFGATSAAVDRQVALGCDEIALASALGMGGAGLARSPEEALIACEELSAALPALRRELAKLPEEDRSLIERRLAGRLSYRKLGAELGVSKDTVARRVRLLFARLRAGLEAQGVTCAPRSDAGATVWPGGYSAP